MTHVVNISNIVIKLKQACEAYYNNEPIITDDEFDVMRAELEAIEPHHLFLVNVGAPLPSNGWPSHTHRAIMGSLAKVKTEEEFCKWAENKGDDFIVSEKYDGSTVVATYEDGHLITLATRGDGKVGENITLNAKCLQNLPITLAEQFSGEVRGEAMLKISTFERHFRPMGYSNPRNAANGKVRDTKDDPLKNYIEVMWFDIIPTDRDLDSEEAKWSLISALGFKTGTRIKANSKVAWEIFARYRDPNPSGDSSRSLLDYEIDGLVLKVNDLELQESFGVTSNRPKGSLAIKFPSEEKETVITDIKWNRGLTGIICPTAHFEPISIGGVNIARASLCGIKEIRRLGVAIGDRVIVSRRNDVIPKMERKISQIPGRADHIAPTHCDLCNEELVIDGAYLYCLNSECQGETYGNIMTWIQEFKIKGLGSSMVRGLIEEGVTDVAKMFEADKMLFQRAANSESNGAKRFNAIQAAKEVRLSTFLSALNIRTLGTTNGQRLEKEFENLEGVLGASIEDLQKVPGIKTNAKKIHAGLREKIALITRLRDLLKIKSLDISGPLAGKSFCITGDLSIPRPQIQDWIKDQGGEVKSGVSKTLNYLITDDFESETGKNKKADKYNIPKISEEDLYVLAGVRP